MQNKPLIFYIALIGMTLLFSAEASAQQKLGDVMTNLALSAGNFSKLFGVFAYTAGVIAAFNGIMRLKAHVEEPQRHDLAKAIKTLLMGGMFLALPFMTSATYSSLFGNQAAGDGQIKVTNSFSTANLTPGGMDQMIVSFVKNTAKPAEGLINVFSYTAAFALLLLGISRMTKRSEEGPRGPAGAGTIMCFVAAGALISFADSMGVFVTSLFGDTTLNMNAQIGSNVIANGTDRAKIQAVIESLMIFVMIVGYIAFIRGWFVLKAFADGSQGATLAQGITFLMGGALAINLGELVNVLQTTVGIDPSKGLTFK